MPREGRGSTQHRNMQRNTDSNQTATVLLHGLFILTTIVVCLTACAPAGDSDRSEDPPTTPADFVEQEPNDWAVSSQELPAILSPGDTFALDGWLGGDTINSNGQPGTRDWFRIDAAAPLQANVRVWIDGPGFVSLSLLEWHSIEGYTLRASDHTGTGYTELTIAIEPNHAGAGLGFGIMETSMSATPGTEYRIEVTAL